jgi:hypothetical protein
MDEEIRDAHARRVATFPGDVKAAHGHSSNHRVEILASTVCGCFYCLALFSPAEIVEWVDADADDIGTTATCPRCGIDSVIGSSSGFPTDAEFLQKMHSYWFQ